MNKEIVIPLGYEARIEGNKVILEQNDEKIRSFLYEFIKVCGWSEKQYPPRENALAYLERQKEQKPKMIQWTGKNLKEVIEFTGKSPRFNEWFKSWEDFENYVHSHGDILKLFCEDGSYYEVPVGAWIVKTPDGYNTPSRFRCIQKPAAWSEEDTYILEDAVTAVDLLGNDDEYSKTHPNLAKAFRAAKDWLKALPERFNLQPKQEWSEGDEGLIDLAVAAVEDFYDEKNPIRVEIIKLLKSLRPQPKQNMSIGFMIYLDEHRPEGKMCLSNAECNQIGTAFKNQDWDTIIRYIEKYRPHWKPSKEQMRALDVALENFYHQDDRAALNSLKIDLQKLL